VRVSRRGALKGEAIGSRGELGAFLLLLRDDEETERLVEADVVIDATGVYANPLHLGPGGLPALGEWECEAYIERHIPDPLGADREIYEGARTLVVGHGHSAVTSLRQLHGLRTHDEGTEIHWVYRADEEPYRVADDDPLPQRATLDAFGNRAAAGDIDGITPHPGRVVESLDCTARGDILCGLRDAEGNIDDIFVDRVVANVGYRPDTEMTRELQVHYCYASEGIMNLAASLLAEGGGSGDCLDQRSPGPEVLTNPETDFFVLGAKSYGRNSDFLLRVGFEQIEQIFEIIEG
jgi:thioredoxin reductase